MTWSYKLPIHVMYSDPAAYIVSPERTVSTLEIDFEKP